MVKAKKHLGQHFLNDEFIAKKIADSLTENGAEKVLEVGPGTGALTKHLLDKENLDVSVIEIDRESVVYLKEHYPALNNKIIEESFLSLDLSKHYTDQFRVIGNFPYNISSQILFKVLDFKELVPEVVGMFQKEVAERVCASHGNKTYGIISVLIQAFYEAEYLFTVNENVFIPPPKVKSGVLRLRRKENSDLGCDPKFFKQIVKMGFNQRRKTLRNSIRPLLNEKVIGNEIFNKRPEQLSVAQFIDITNLIS